MKVKFADFSVGFARFSVDCRSVFFFFSPSFSIIRSKSRYFFPRERARRSCLFDPPARIICTFEGRNSRDSIRNSRLVGARLSMRHGTMISNQRVSNADTRVESLTCARRPFKYDCPLIRDSLARTDAERAEISRARPLRYLGDLLSRQGKFHYSLPISIPIESRAIPSIKE